MWCRRNFIKTLGTSALALAGGAFSASGKPMEERSPFTRVTILHTNDVHSRIDPFPMDGSSLQGRGGAARRAAIINRIREQEEHVLLFDSGDIFQGTPYFNMFEGEPEFMLMESMQYDAATLGNHDFDAGMEVLTERQSLISFPFVCSNYHFDDTGMEGHTRPYHIIRKGPVKIGIIGLGIELQGLAAEVLYRGTRVSSALDAAKQYANILRNDYQCDYIIALSHLGHQYADRRISDVLIAQNTTDIDLILGGHTHTFMEQPEIVANAEGKPVIIHQAGWAGVVLGRVDIVFEQHRKNRCTLCRNLLV